MISVTTEKNKYRKFLLLRSPQMPRFNCYSPNLQMYINSNRYFEKLYSTSFSKKIDGTEVSEKFKTTELFDKADVIGTSEICERSERTGITGRTGRTERSERSGIYTRLDTLDRFEKADASEIFINPKKNLKSNLHI